MKIWIKWRYYRIDYQPIKDGWRLWFYRIYYDGYHNSLHIGPIVLEFGDGIHQSMGDNHQQHHP